MGAKRALSAVPHLCVIDNEPLGSSGLRRGLDREVFEALLLATDALKFALADIWTPSPAACSLACNRSAQALREDDGG